MRSSHFAYFGRDYYSQYIILIVMYLDYEEEA